MSVQCRTCGVFINKGTKFNMRKEDVIGEDYLGIDIYRFYFKCPQCSTEITFKTDPKINDYIMEHGAHRIAEPLRKQEEELKNIKNTKQKDENNDSIEDLVHRAGDSRQERDILANLERLR